MVCVEQHLLCIAQFEQLLCTISTSVARSVLASIAMLVSGCVLNETCMPADLHTAADID